MRAEECVPHTNISFETVYKHPAGKPTDEVQIVLLNPVFAHKEDKS